MRVTYSHMSSTVMRIKVTSNQNVYNCVSVVQQPQRQQPSPLPAASAGYTSSSRITSSSNSIFSSSNKNINSSLSTTVNGSGNVTNQGHSQQQQDVFSIRSKPQETEGLDANNSTNKTSGSSKRLRPFEVSGSPPIQSAGSGDSGEAFLHNDNNDYNGDSEREGDDRHSRGLNGSLSNTHDDDDDTNNENDSNQDKQRPSNEKLLGTAFMSFMTFSLIQLCFAFIAESQAMKGDSAAMIVDSMTYLSNWIAEKRKSTFDQTYLPPPPIPLPFSSSSPDNYDPVREAKRLKERARRKMVLTLEILPPLISVSALIGITIVVLKQAIHVLLMDRYRQQKDQTDPNIHVMLAFSTCNLGLDALNVFCFAKSKHLTGFQTLPSPDPHPHSTTTSTIIMGAHSENKSISARQTSGSYLEIDQTSSHDDDDDDDDRNNMSTYAKDEKYHSQQQQQKLDHADTSPNCGDQAVELSAASRDDDDDESSHGDGEEANLNMVRLSSRCKFSCLLLFVHVFVSQSHTMCV